MKTKTKQEINQKILTGERALFHAEHLCIKDTIFGEGESPLKESNDIELYGSSFQWKYPLWYAKNIKAIDCTWFQMARAGVWYSQNLYVERAVIEAPKNFRRCSRLTLKEVNLPNAEETLWSCKDITMEQVNAKGDYFAMNCENMRIDGFTLVGNYSFDGVKNAEIHHAKLLSKDAFWNTENVTVYDSYISGEYLGWNAKNLTLINCTIESLQGMCYIENLIMQNCKLLNTTLAFEYSSVDVQINSRITSVFNPKSGTIKADKIEELILEKDRIHPEKTTIICREETEKITEHVVNLSSMEAMDRAV